MQSSDLSPLPQRDLDRVRPARRGGHVEGARRPPLHLLGQSLVMTGAVSLAAVTEIAASGTRPFIATTAQDA